MYFEILAIEKYNPLLFRDEHGSTSRAAALYVATLRSLAHHVAFAT